MHCYASHVSRKIPPGVRRVSYLFRERTVEKLMQTTKAQRRKERTPVLFRIGSVEGSWSATNCIPPGDLVNFVICLIYTKQGRYLPMHRLLCDLLASLLKIVIMFLLKKYLKISES